MTTALDFICGTNISRTNDGGPGGAPETLYGRALAVKLNELLTRQFRLGYLIEQTPDDDCFVSVDTATQDPDKRDALGLPRPAITYNLSDYTKLGFVVARQTATAIFAAMGATEKTAFKTAHDYRPTDPKRDASVFEVTYLDADPKTNTPLRAVPPGTPGAKTEYFNFFGAGHVVGTYRMGDDKSSSVVDKDSRSWDHRNLFLVGSGVFPTVATGNPTLTIAALALRAAKTILQDLEAAAQ
jgi:glucose dehydrogenase